MKFRSVVIFSAMVVFMSGAADAAIVNFGSPITGGGENITSSEVISNGQSGSIFTSPNAEGGEFDAYLPNNSTITFSYNFSDSQPSRFIPFPQVSIFGGVFPFNYAQANTYGDGKFTYHFDDVFATANLTGSSLTNHSGEVIAFSSYFSGLLQQVSNGVGGTVGKISYSVSAVPLPSSVVMFASAIAALFGFSYLSRQRKSTILQA